MRVKSTSDRTAPSTHDLSVLISANDAFISLDGKLRILAARVDQVQSTIGPKISSALDAVIELQDRTTGMEEVLVEVRSLDHIAALKSEISTYQSAGLREIAAAQRQHAAELTRQLTHLEADVVSDLNGFKSRADRLVLDNEMTGARLSALETLARNRHDGSTPLPACEGHWRRA